jgi:hypothetical protein
MSLDSKGFSVLNIQAKILKGLCGVKRGVGVGLLVSQLDDDAVRGLEQVSGTLLSSQDL